MKILAAGFLVSALALLGGPAMAHHYDRTPEYQMPPPAYPVSSGPTYNFYGPTTNYFGSDPGQDAQPAGYYGAPAFYGEAKPHGWQDLPPQQYYDDARLDPWNGYDGYRGLENGY